MEDSEPVSIRRHMDSGISVGEEEKLNSHIPTDSTDDEDTVFKESMDEGNALVTGEEEDDNKEKDDSALQKRPGPLDAVKKSFLSTANEVKYASKYLTLTLLIWIIGLCGFSFLWLALGVMIFSWREHRKRSKEAITEALSSIAKDERKYFQTIKDIYKLSGRDLPSWVYFPDVEKAEWLNKMLQQLWPYVGDYVKNVILEKVEPSICESNKLLRGFRFCNVELGEKSPRVAGIKVYGDGQTRRSEIVMDVQIIYDSFCNIKVSMNKLNAGIKNLSVRGILRVELSPLVDTIPLVGAVSVAFVHQPTIDFDLTDLGNLFDVPLLDSVLRSAISETVNRMVVLPDKYIVKLCDEATIGHLLHPLPEGVVRIHVIEAKNLEEKDKKVLGIGGGSDPFVEVKVGLDNEFKTRIIEHNVNPQWNESFDALVSEFHTSSIEITLFDDDGALNKADYLGSASVSLKSVYNQGVIDEWIPLSNVKHGSIHVRVEWFDLSDDLAHLKEAMEYAGKHDKSSALLSVYVDSARDLPGFNEGKYEPNPQVKIFMPGIEKPFKTKVIPHSNNPTWEENFRALIQNPRMESITFKMEDAGSKEEVLGTLRVRVKQLLNSPQMMKEEPFQLSNSGPNSQISLYLSVRLLMKKGRVDANSSSQDGANSSFVVAEKTSSSADILNLIKPKPIPEKVEETLQPSTGAEATTANLPVPTTTAEHSSAGSSVSDFSIDFVDKTLAYFVGNGTRTLTETSSLHRNASITSDISNTLEATNLKERLDNRLPNNNKEDANAPLGRIQLTLSYSSEKEKLFVNVHKAQNLIVCDEDNNTSDPYVRTYIMPHKRSSSRRKTKVVKNSVNPVFNERLEYSFLRGELKEHQLDVSVKNKTGLLSSEKVLMGQILIDFAKINWDEPVKQWYTLEVHAESDK